MTAFPENGQGSVSISVEGNTLTTTSDAPVPYKFENAGDIQVSATFTPEGNGTPITDSITVKVVSSSFSGKPVFFLNEKRGWLNPGLDDLAVIKFDRNLNVYESSLNPGRRLDIKVLKDVPSYVVARLGNDGPIMASSEITVIKFAVNDDGTLYVIKTYQDGSVLMEGRIGLSYIPLDMVIYLYIRSTGITFDDGTTEREITAADFDSSGVYRYRMLRSADASVANCHTIIYYQDGISLYGNN